MNSLSVGASVLPADWTVVDHTQCLREALFQGHRIEYKQTANKSCLYAVCVLTLNNTVHVFLYC